METLVITVAAAMIVILEKDMFFETRHVGKLLAARYGETNVGKLLAARYGETNVASVGKSSESLTFSQESYRISDIGALT